MQMEPQMQLINLEWFESSIKDSKKCIIGVSGGIDSMVLLHWLAQNKNNLPDIFEVMHIDHGIHPQSAEWAIMVEHTCANLGLKCTVQKVSIDVFGKNVEYAARQARYRAFCATGADSLVLAHHMNDQIETFFLKLFRGSGIRGLKSMPAVTTCWYDADVNVIRPLLNVSRSTIEAYAAMNDIKHCEDTSNADLKYDRNYIRHAVWPVIAERFDIADININKSIELLGEAWELTTALAENDLKNAEIESNMLDWTKIKDLSMVRIKNLILHILGINHVYGYSIGHIEQFAYGLQNATFDSKNELYVKGFKLRKHGKKIFIETETANVPSDRSAA
jgi:tRNA(Ile)-lysidine synthase